MSLPILTHPRVIPLIIASKDKVVTPIRIDILADSWTTYRRCIKYWVINVYVLTLAVWSSYAVALPIAQ